MRRVAAFVAPVAEDAGAVVGDAVSLDVADAIYQAFGDLGVDGGLTRAYLLLPPPQLTLRFKRASRIPVT